MNWRPRFSRPRFSPLASPRTALDRTAPLWLRLRLTFFYGVLSIASGAALLFITYLLLARSQRAQVSGPVWLGEGPVPPDAAIPPDVPVPPDADPAPRPRFRAIEVDPGSHDDVLRMLLLAGLALAIMTLVSIALGWLFAGRVLRPVRTMTATLRQISARNLHERLAVSGPRNEIKDLADTIDGLLSRLEVALDGHKRFVANAAHELRTPLTVEHALLEEPLIDPDVTLESFRANFERLLALSEQRGRLLESLLTLSGSEHGREHYQPLDLGLLAEQVLSSHRPELDHRGLQVDAAIEPVRILGDPALIERLVGNLLENAAQHNRDGGWVEVGTRTEADRVVLFVANSGPAVPREQVGRLIEPFQRLHRVADDGHHGLGLSIVQAIAAAHDAELIVQARMSGGLFVEVAFPALTEASTSPVAPEPASAGART
jgi:signal transduction histidine kinase